MVSPGWAAASVYGNQPAADGRPGGVNLLALAYLNRLSDLLFVLARVANLPTGDVLWQPGGGRVAAPAKKAGAQAGAQAGEDTPE